MKRWSVLFLALALWALAGCGGPAADEGAAGEAPSVFAEASAPDAEGGLSAVRLEGQARPLTDEEIQAAYFRAEEAYGWFSLETLPCGEKTQTIDGWLYYPVEYPGMENLADLRAYLRGLFSEELVDALLASGGAHPLYQDVDGALYVLPTSRERDESKGQADIQIKPYGQAGYSVIVEVDLLADGGSTVTGVESYAFPYEFLEDRWVFTDFHLIDPRVGRGARWSVPTDRAPAPEAAAGCAVLAGHGGGDQPCGDRLPGAGGKGQEYPPPLAASGTGEKGKAVPGV